MSESRHYICISSGGFCAAGCCTGGGLRSGRKIPARAPAESLPFVGTLNSISILLVEFSARFTESEIK